MGQHRAAARRRAGRDPQPSAGPGPARPDRRDHRPHARRPLPGRRRPALPLPVGRCPPRCPCRCTCRRAVRPRLDALAMAISERVGFFDAAFDAVEYDPEPTVDVGDLQVRFVRGTALRPGVGRGRRGAERRSARLHRRHRPVRRGGRGCAGPTCCWSRRPCTDTQVRRSRARAPHRGRGARHGPCEQARAALLVHYAPKRRAELEALCRAGAGPGPRRRCLTISGPGPCRARRTALAAASDPGPGQETVSTGRRILRGPHAHPGGHDPGDPVRARPPVLARAGRRPARPRRHPGER